MIGIFNGANAWPCSLGALGIFAYDSVGSRSKKTVGKRDTLRNWFAYSDDQ
jgi:hypothetical protein